MDAIALQAKNISKHFPGVLANDHINFDLRKGEIHTLLGENGAGKTTLMNILDGIYYPDEGEIYLNGKRVDIRSPFEATKNGIGMIHQHFMLVDTLTVLENVILGLESQGFYLDKKNISEKIAEISKKYNLDINPYAKIWQLSVGEQQRVEIIKTLFRGAEILIMDEPTAVLTPQESNTLFEILKRMTKEGKSIIFISHKLDEVMKISDRITVLRKGKLAGTVNTKEINQKELAMMMVGREVLFKLNRKPLNRKGEILKIEGLETYNDKGIKILKEINFSIYGGEIFGLAGVSGNGQKELAEVISGLRRATRGKVCVKGEDVTNFYPKVITKKGVNYIPSDRLKVGLVPNLNTVENAILRRYDKEPISRGIFLNYEEAAKYTRELVKQFNIMVPRENVPVKFLSGGNLQKLILAREIREEPALLIAVHPSRGLDIGATEFIRKKLLEERDQGVAILLISEDLEELLMISDRIGVIYEGEIEGIVDIDSADINEIGLMMAGVHKNRLDK
ncbi:MAG TPA: ABC transporter ATP-binding protein [Atribacterota bacterium]|nr:ABC transporter ATP-binding protein [Atribacterota bacterium]